MTGDFNSLRQPNTNANRSTPEADNVRGFSGEESDHGDNVMRYGRNQSGQSYQTADANSDDGTSSSSNASDHDVGSSSTKYKKFVNHRQKKRDDATYGVFGESDSDDDNQRTNLKRQRTISKNPVFSSKKTIKPIFVKSVSEPPNNDITKDKSVVLEPKPVSNEVDEANQYFLNLLTLGRSKRISKQNHSLKSGSTFPMESRNHDNDYGQMDTGSGRRYEETIGVGLGFSHASDMHREDSVIPQAGIGIQSGQHIQRNRHNVQSIFEGTSAVPESDSNKSNSEGNIFYSFGVENRKSLLQLSSKQDINVGNWEKHTKGIGLKLLSKMGYGGSGGIGKRKQLPTTVADKPIEVKVRPVNLGLGFGSFKESTSVQKKDDNTTKTNESKKLFSESSFPSNNELLQEKSWRKNKKEKFKTKRIIVGYHELLEKQQTKNDLKMKIIDMRGPVANEGSSISDRGDSVSLGDEVLHNITILLNTYESKVLLTSQYASSSRRKYESIQSDSGGIERRNLELKNRKHRLENFKKVLDEIDVDVSKTTDTTITGRQSLVAQILEKLLVVANTFSNDELDTLQFSSAMVPAILEPVVKEALEDWNILTSSVNTTVQVVRFVLFLSQDLSNPLIDLGEVRLTMFMEHLLPRVISVLESSRWNPIKDYEAAILGYEAIFKVIKGEVDPLISLPDETGDVVIGSLLAEQFASAKEEARLTSMELQQQVVRHVVYKKLHTFVKYWEPRLVLSEDMTRMQIEDPIDAWIIPWLPHLFDAKGLTAQLVADCKMKIKATLTVLQKKIYPTKYSESQNDAEFISAVIQLLQPWRGILKMESIHGMVSESVTHRLARFVMSIPISSERDVGLVMDETLGVLYRMHSSYLLSDIEFLSIFEAEYLTRCVSFVNQQVNSNLTSLEFRSSVNNYLKWRKRTMEAKPVLQHTGHRIESREYGRSFELLQRDSRICGCLYAILLLLRAGAETNTILAEKLETLLPPYRCNYLVIIAIRKEKIRDDAENDLMRLNFGGSSKDSKIGEIAARIRIKKQSSGVRQNNLVFRDVVEEYAKDKNIMFQPKFGENSTKDGKQIFLLGPVQIYLEHDVVFAQQYGGWTPLELDKVADIVQQAESKL